MLASVREEGIGWGELSGMQNPRNNMIGKYSSSVLAESALWKLVDEGHPDSKDGGFLIKCKDGSWNLKLSLEMKEKERAEAKKKAAFQKSVAISRAEYWFIKQYGESLDPRTLEKLRTKHSERCHKSRSQSLIGKTAGEINGNWRGGISFLPYSPKFNSILKESIRERDFRTCQLCSIAESEHGRKLDVHHIDYCKKNSNQNNLISLCAKCHRKTNFDREKWRLLFEKLISIRKETEDHYAMHS